MRARLLALAAALALGVATTAAAGQITRVSVASSGTQGKNSSFNLAISGDGRYVAFHLRAWTEFEMTPQPGRW